MATSPDGGAAQSVQETSDAPGGGPVIPAYIVDDDRTVIGDTPQPVYIVSDAELEAGDYHLEGRPLALPIVFDDTRGAKGGKPLAVYLVNPSEPGAVVDSFVNGPATGTRTQTGSFWTIEDQALRGGIQPASPVWGGSRVVYTDNNGQPLTWQAGRVIAALITLSDFADPLVFGLSSSATPTDPNADTGYHWILDAGKLKIRTKDQTITYEPGQSNIRTMTYLAYWLLLDMGAALFLQTVTDDMGGGMTDPIGMFNASNARLVGVWERGTLPTFYPVISALGTGNPYIYPGGHQVQQVRVVDVPELQPADVLASFADRFDRANTPSAIGNAWNAIGCTAGIMDGAAYISAGSGFQFVMHANSLADCRIVCDLTFPAFPVIPLVGVIVHGDSVANFQNGIRIHTNGGNNLFIQAVQNRGFLDTIYSGPVTWQASNRVEILLYQNQYKVFINYVDVTFGMWRVDANSYYSTQTHIGLYSQADPNTARWGNVQVYPHSMPVPESLQMTVGPTLFTQGTRIQNGFGGGSVVTGSWTNNAGVMTQSIASGEAFYRIPQAQTSNLQIAANFILPSGNPTSLAGLGIGSFNGTTIQHGLLARIYRDPPSQPSNHEIELLLFTNGVGQIIRKTPLGVFFTASTTYRLGMQIGADRHRDNSEILYVLVNGKVWLSYPVLPGGVRGDIILYANSLDTDTKIDNLQAHQLS